MTTPPPDGASGRAASGSGHQPMTPDQWREGFTAANGREPTMSEYQNAVAAGWIRQEGQRGQAAEQFSESAKKFAAGTKDLWNHRVVPAASSAAGSVRAQAGGRGTKLPLWGDFAVPVLSLLVILSAAMPAAKIGHPSFSFFSEGGDGVLILLAGLLTILAAGAFLVLRAKWAKITAGVLGILTGIVCAFDGFHAMATVSSFAESSENSFLSYTEYGSVSLGAGAVLLAVFGLLLLVAAVLMLLPGQAPASQVPMGQAPTAQAPAGQAPAAQEHSPRPHGNDVPPTA